ncbi:hypothetical protein KAW50_03860 [candidate division WOR-3 bacterium]|nr:hypothetical protein [candidate division WOR-3 bacterium]
MKSYIYAILCVSAVSILMAGCAKSPEVIANRDFYDQQYTDALTGYKKLVDEKYNKKDKSYIIYLLNYALLNHYAGHFDEARKNFWTAYQVEEGKVSELAKTFEWMKAGAKRVYKLKKREKMLLHFYLGMNYIFADKTEESIIEYKKIHLLEEDKPKLPLVCFYMGKAYEIEGKYDDALIEYRTLLELTKEEPFPPTYLELARIHDLRGEKEKATEYMKKFVSIADKPQCSIFEGYTIPEGYSELIVQIDQDRLDVTDDIKIYVDGKYVGKARLLDVFRPGVTGGEIARKMMKEVSSKVARDAGKDLMVSVGASAIPFVGGCIGGQVGKRVLGNKEDKRSWYYAPAGFSLFVGYIPENARRVKIEFIKKVSTSRGCLTPSVPSTAAKSEQLTYDLHSMPCVRIKDQIFLTARFQSMAYDKLQE